MSAHDYDPDGPAQRAADVGKFALVSRIHGRIVIVLPLDTSATDAVIVARIARVDAALQKLRLD